MTIHDAASAAAAWVRGEREAVWQWCGWGDQSPPMNIALRPEGDAAKVDRCARTAAVALELQDGWCNGGGQHMENFLTYMRDGGVE
jgi:hypothetical protein